MKIKDNNLKLYIVEILTIILLYFICSYFNQYLLTGIPMLYGLIEIHFWFYHLLFLIIFFVVLHKFSFLRYREKYKKKTLFYVIPIIGLMKGYFSNMLTFIVLHVFYMMSGNDSGALLSIFIDSSFYLVIILSPVVTLSWLFGIFAEYMHIFLLKKVL